jgi:hypothetical protein
MFKKLFSRINKTIMKYFGFILYPTCKLGKEQRNKEMQSHYK